MDLNAILWTIVVGIPCLAFFLYISGLIAIPLVIMNRLRPRPKKTRQLTLAPFMHGRYPYERRWVAPEDDNEYSEAKGYESSAQMDLEDTEDN